jgi:hypothetical protein
MASSVITGKRGGGEGNGRLYRVGIRNLSLDAMHQGRDM